VNLSKRFPNKNMEKRREKGKKKMSLEKKVIIAEAVVIVGVLVYLFFATTPTPSAPVLGKTIFEHDVILEVGEGEEVIISKDPAFKSPIILEGGESIDLPPGTYYWKVKNWLRESKIQSFTIQSNVGLDIFKVGNAYELENSGNVDLEVEGKKSGITTNIEVGELKEVEEDVYEGEQNG
jgi:hypothetical protein